MDEPCSKYAFDFLHDDFFINEILSLVHCAKSLFRLGMTSKRFSSLCSYPSVLEFRNVQYNDVGLIKYLDEFLDSSMKKKNLILQKNLKRLYVSLSMKMDAPRLLDFVTVHLLRWFYKVLSLDVQELFLQFNGGPLDPEYTHQRLELNLQDSMIPLKNLRFLNLKDIPISLNDGFGAWISTYCVGLEELTLYDILVLSTNLTITSSSLKIFNIQGDFEELHVVSSPKLVSLRVTWTPINLDRDESHPLIKISNTPNLEFFQLYDSDSFYDSLTYDSSCDNDSKFSALKCACVSYAEALSSIIRLLHDISSTRTLNIYGHFLQEMSLEGRMQHYANQFKMLEKLAVFIKEYEGDEGDEEYQWWEVANATVSFAKSISSLKFLKLIAPNRGFDSQTPLGWLQNALCLNVQELDLQTDDNDKNMDKYNYLNVPELNLQDCMVSLKNLTILTLKNIPMGLNHNFEDWISTCTNLQELNLKGVLVIPTSFKITSSSLKVFTIDAHFRELHVSASKLVILRVTWNLVYLGTNETNLSLKVSEYSPDLTEFWLSNLQSSLPLEYHNCGDDRSSFPSLESATLLIPETNNNVSLDSMERLLLDVRPATKLSLSDTIIRKISCSKMLTHAVNSINKLEKLRICVEVIKKSGYQVVKEIIKPRCWENAHEAIVSLVKKVPSLKTLELRLEKDYYGPLVSKTFKESLGDIHLKSGFSTPIVYLDNPPNHEVEIQVGVGDDETLLLEHIIKNFPRRWKFMFIYRHN